MKNILTATFLTCICITGSAQINHGYPIDPVPFTSVKVTDNFWGQRLQASREVTILWHSANVKRRDVTKTL